MNGLIQSQLTLAIEPIDLLSVFKECLIIDIFIKDTQAEIMVIAICRVLLTVGGAVPQHRKAAWHTKGFIKQTITSAKYMKSR